MVHAEVDPQRGPRPSPTARPASGSRCSAARCVPWRGARRAARCSTGTTSRPGSTVSSTSPSPGPTTGTSASTRSPARCSSVRRCGRPTATLRQYGAVPPQGAAICGSPSYRTGGGRARQRGPRAGPGAQDQRPVRRPGGEPHAGRRRGARRRRSRTPRLRGPLVLRSRGRAVTAEDFERAGPARSRPERARVHCVAEAGQAAGVRVLVVPHVAGDEVGRIRREDLDPARGDPASGSAPTSTSGGWSAPGW